MKGLFIPGITAEMFRSGCLESIEALMADGEIYDIDYEPEIKTDRDTISRQQAINAIDVTPFDDYGDYLRVRDIIDLLPSVQPEPSDEVAFWKKRAKEYEDIILKLVTEQVNTKFDSVEITGKHIIFKKSQPERKKGKWIYEGIRGRFPACKCSICGSVENADWAVTPNGANFCPYCGSDMREETEDEEK